MKEISDLQTKPVWQLTVSELVEVMRSAAPAVQPKLQNRIKINGIRGIAKHLPCSSRTAQKLKDSGLFPVYWIGGRFFVYSDELEAGIREWNGRA